MPSRKQRNIFTIFGFFLIWVQSLIATANGIECGTSAQMSIQERVNDCRTKLGNLALHTIDQHFNWVLVAQNDQGSEVWRDETPVPVWESRINMALPKKVLWTSLSRIRVHYEVAVRICRENFGLQTLKGNLRSVFKLPEEFDGYLYRNHQGPSVFSRLAHRLFWGEDVDSEVTGAGTLPRGGLLPRSPLDQDFILPVVRRVRERIVMGSELTETSFRPMNADHEIIHLEDRDERNFARCIAFEDLPPDTTIPPY